MSNKDINKFVKVLKDHTNRASKTLYNASSLEVVVAITMISRKGNEVYLEAYNEWVNKLDKKDIVLDNQDQIQ